MSKSSDKFLRNLAVLQSPAFIKAVEGALFEAADMVKAEAQQSITRGSVSGKGHRPSPAGDPPHNNTGVLKSHIETAISAPLEATVTAGAPYSAALEFGTSTIAARPFMRPARDKVRGEAQKLLTARVNRFIKTEMG